VFLKFGFGCVETSAYLTNVLAMETNQNILPAVKSHGKFPLSTRRRSSTLVAAHILRALN
jgi:hypothetical protein